jgi:glyoxylase-like metal-dependent hydrolase (beta-lactamase superfamily II)
MLRNVLILFTLLINCSPSFGQINYEIYAIRFAGRIGRQAITQIAVGSTSKDSVNTCFMFWLVRGNGKNILVDAGFSDDQEINPKYIVYTRPDTMLKRFKVKPEEISDIIITHPHWDHIGGIDEFPNATIWMQKADYNYFVTDAWQPNGTNDEFNKSDVLKIIQKNFDGKLKLIDGDNKEIIPGIKVFTGSKHTYESQFVLIGTGENKVIIASDNSWYYYNLYNLLPVPITMDSSAYVKNLKRMREMVPNNDLIIPGHDPEVFTKFPSVARDIVKIK